jgi:phenylalanyl-tRNA synthetase beta chain
MKISLNWLQDFIDVSSYKPKLDQLAQILTSAGLEVEDIDDKARTFADVVVGLILKKSPHPNADKLTVCEVTTGEGVVHQIVCGAKNHAADDRVIVALPGAVLPGNFAIKKSVIRGVESGGMLCSLKELGLATESDGIEILPVDAPVGKAFAAYKGFDDAVFELKVTPNRADCLSHFGLARELGCLLKKPVKEPESQLSTGNESTTSFVQLEVRAPEACPRYAGRGIRGVKVAESPQWLKRRLESVGLKSINNVVDVTNYVMMEMGQPLHAFDVRFLRGQKIRVDHSVRGEKFKTLDGTELTLTGEELMIRDAEVPVAMGGVIGGLNSGIQDDTKDVFVEAAYFAPQVVRRSL